MPFLYKQIKTSLKFVHLCRKKPKMDPKNHAIPHNNGFIFKNFIAYLKAESALNVTELFLKNLNLLKKNIQPTITITQKIPSLNEICLLYCSKIASKYFFFFI